MESIYLAALGDLIDRPGIFWFTTTGTFPFAFVMSSQKTACPCSLISLSLSLSSLSQYVQELLPLRFRRTTVPILLYSPAPSTLKSIFRLGVSVSLRKRLRFGLFSPPTPTFARVYSVAYLSGAKAGTRGGGKGGEGINGKVI